MTTAPVAYTARRGGGKLKAHRLLGACYLLLIYGAKGVAICMGCRYDALSGAETDLHEIHHCVHPPFQSLCQASNLTATALAPSHPHPENRHRNLNVAHFGCHGHMDQRSDAAPAVACAGCTGHRARCELPLLTALILFLVLIVATDRKGCQRRAALQGKL